MPKGGTSIFCPTCKAFKPAKAVRPDNVARQRGRRWYMTEHRDVAWFRRARRCGACETVTLTAELDEKLLSELVELRALLAKKNASKVRKIRKQNKWLVRKETVPEEIAADFIRATAWWHTHSSGSPVRAPGHADRMFESRHGWTVEFGANTFLVGKAIERCAIKIDEALREAEAGRIPAKGALVKELKLAIRGAVANFDGNEYGGYYPLTEDDMMFGAQSIDVSHGASFMIKVTGIGDLLDDA